MEHKYGLFFPMLSLFLWTLLMLIRSAFLRLNAIKSGKVPLRFFETFKGSEPPEAIVKAGNNVNNLTQMPPLFYIICLYISLKPIDDGLLCSLAWLYVGLRIAHSIVHISSNKVPIRFTCFLLSMMTLAALWIRTAFLLCSL